MKNNPEIDRLYDAALKEIFFQLSQKYSGQRVFKFWEKIKMAGENEAYFGVSGWKPEKTIDDDDDGCVGLSG